MHDTTPCPCGSTSLYSDCCQPMLADHSRIETAEQLMRSRYTAFVLRHDQHILASWHPKTRPQSLNHEENPVTWLGLEIHSSTDGLPDGTGGSVEFTASYVENGQLCRLREKSTFLHEGGLWYYVQGDCKVAQSKISRNQPCPCDSGKKFKRCCLNLSKQG